MAKKESTLKTLLFISVLCVTAAVVLATISQGLQKRQETTRTAYRNRQLFIAARILTFDGYFEIQDEEGDVFKANMIKGELKKTDNPQKATAQQIDQLYTERVRPMLATEGGKSSTFEDAEIDFKTYMKDHEKEGYYNLPHKLYFVILPESDDPKALPYGYIFPINGYGLWDAIYGLLGLDANCNNVLGMSWYDQKETPGLGGEIAEEWWQKQFTGKQIFQEESNGVVNFKSAPLGIKVVKPGKMQSLPKSEQKSSVDGVTGATITSTGVMAALKTSLEPYRNTLIKLRNEWKKKKGGKG